MEDNIYVPQKNKKLANCETAYIFKGLGLNLIPYSPSTTQLQKIKNYLTFLDTNKEFKTTYIPVGDKISISRRIIDEQNNSNTQKWETPK